MNLFLVKTIFLKKIIFQKQTIILTVSILLFSMVRVPLHRLYHFS